MSYEANAASVDRLLTKKGQLITVYRYTPTRNSSTGAVVKGEPMLAGEGYAVEVPVTQTLIDSFATRLDAGALVSKTLRALKVSPALGFKPQPQDEVTFSDGSVWPVVGCTGIAPDGTPLLYTIGVAK